MLPPGILATSRIRLDSTAASKKKALQISAELIVTDMGDIKSDMVFDKLLEREQLGSTGMSNGIALPHARVAGISRPRGALLRLSEAINFDAIDGEPVDIIFALLVPENAEQTHLDILAALARAFSSKSLCEQIRNTPDSDDILLLLTTLPNKNATSDNSPGSIRLPA